MIRPLLAGAGALAIALATTGSLTAQDSPIKVCDPRKSTLCSGVAAVFDFEEATDSARWDAAGGSYLLEQFVDPATGNITAYDVSQSTDSAKCRLGNCAQFSGSNLLQAAGSGALGNGYWSVSVWVYVASPVSADMSVVDEYTSNDKGSGMSLTYSGGALYPRIWGFSQEGVPTLCELVSTTAITLNARNHIIYGVSPYKSGSAQFFISVNGGARQTAPIGYALRNASNRLTVGGRPDATYKFTGYMDQLIFFGKAVTDAEIALLYNAGSGRAFPWTTSP